MKKVVLLFCVLMSCAITYAQDDCMAFFPDTEGTVLISKSYNTNNDLLNTITYTIEEAYQNQLGESMTIGCDITDAMGNVINKGQISADCIDGNFYLKMKSEAVAPEFFEILGCNTQLVGNFLDYPNTFTSIDRFQSDFAMDEGEYTVQTKDKKDRMTVRVYDRQYEKNERITTPAGTFDASKISFMFESEKDKNVETHKGVEWYAVGAGIVRSETYDKEGNLESYTVLTSLDTK